MTLIVVSSVSGAPGVTSLALGMAATWPDEARPVVVECDPSGGDIAARYSLTPSPGLVELVAHRTESDALSRAAQQVQVTGCSVGVVCSPPGGREVAAALPALSADRTLTTDGVVVADVGRLTGNGAAWGLLRDADAVVLVVTGTLGHIAHLRTHLAHVTEPLPATRFVVAVAGGPYDAADVAATDLATPDTTIVDAPFGPRVARLLDSGGLSARRTKPIMQGWRSIAEACLTPPVTPDPVENVTQAGGVEVSA